MTTVAASSSNCLSLSYRASGILLQVPARFPLRVGVLPNAFPLEGEGPSQIARLGATNKYTEALTGFLRISRGRHNTPGEAEISRRCPR